MDDGECQQGLQITLDFFLHVRQRQLASVTLRLSYAIIVNHWRKRQP
jgi:hypothetical protein